MHNRSFNRTKKVVIGLTGILLGIVLLLAQRNRAEVSINNTFDAEIESNPLSPMKASKAARWEYIYSLLRNPETNEIPPSIRYRELKHAEQIKTRQRFSGKRNKAALDFFEVGPSDVGGRTRALAIDLNNADRLIAGGVSGGIWESTDGGLSWSPVQVDGDNLSVTYIVQDPREGNRDTWYYASGEFTGNSASDPARVAPYFGSGVYKSTDNGNTWALLPAATPSHINRFDSPFDFVSKIAISPTTGTLFLASNVIGIYRSADGGNTFGPNHPDFNFPRPALGGPNDHDWSDVSVNANGVVLATLSSVGSNSNPADNPGVYLSTNDGVSWRDITPPSFPDVHGRSVIAFAPSNPDIAYIFTTTLRESNGREDVRMHKINVQTGFSEDLSSNLPRLSEAGNIDTQGGYNMALAVKPDDENFVLFGGTNAYRSRDGFSSSLIERLDVWIGGYDAEDDDFGNYDNHHPDQHIFVFDPANPNRVWNGNDGGIYMTNSITQANKVTWNDRNQGYNVTQFYTVALAAAAFDPRIAGGSQDNGTPFIRLDDLSAGSRNISVGDGAHLYFGESFAFVGFQNGSTLRLTYNIEDTPTFAGFSFIQPESASDQLFVTPFLVDPNDEDIMYYPAGNVLWRNDQLSTLRGGQSDREGSDEGWSRVEDLPFLGARNITALGISHQPAHVLYYAASDRRMENPAAPQLYRLENANTTTGSNVAQISIPSAPNGGYVVDIAVNPDNADEIMIVFSNYDIVGLYHSTNGGASYTAVEGNLTGNTDFPGPSIRAATILPTDGAILYFVGTSTGLYSTSTLNGDATVWEFEGEHTIGNAVVWDVTSRTSDDAVAVATHGRGLFLGSLDDDFTPAPSTDSFSLGQNYPNPFASNTLIVYNLPVRSRVSIALFDLSGRKVADIVNNEEKETGREIEEFNAASLASGVYIYRLEATPLENTSEFAPFSESRKMMVLK